MTYSQNKKVKGRRAQGQWMATSRLACVLDAVPLAHASRVAAWPVLGLSAAFPVRGRMSHDVEHVG